MVSSVSLIYKNTCLIFDYMNKRCKSDSMHILLQKLDCFLVCFCRADVSYHDMEEINKVQSAPDLERFLTNIYPCIYTCSHSCIHCCDTVLPCDRALSNVFEVDLPEPRRGVLLELYVQGVYFCREQNFKNEQTSVLLSILKSIHQANIGKEA